MQQRNWRNKTTPELINLMEGSIDIRLYLIAEKGPLSFTFQDDNSKKYFVNIGDKVTCSCNNTGKNEHCIHTIYTLNRMFKIDFADPLINQIGFTDSELSKMIETRNSLINKVSSVNSNITKVKNTGAGLKILNDGKRKCLSEDANCPICQEDMYSQDNLFYCSDSCGSNFHSNCIKIWMTNKKNSGDDRIPCPMCRSNFNEDEINKNQLKAQGDTTKHNNRRHFKVSCKICGRNNLKGERFHCLNCEDFDICIECFFLEKHDKKHFLLIKKAPEDKWQGLENNQSVVNKKKDHLFKKYTISQLKLTQFLPTLLKLESLSKNDLNLDGEVDDLEHTLERLEQMKLSEVKPQEKCIICNSKHKSSLPNLAFKLLDCGHVVHMKCSEKLFKINEQSNTVGENFNICTLDQKVIFPGLTSLKFKVKVHEEGNNNNQNNNISNEEKKAKAMSNNQLHQY